MSDVSGTEIGSGYIYMIRISCQVISSAKCASSRLESSRLDSEHEDAKDARPERRELRGAPCRAAEGGRLHSGRARRGSRDLAAHGRLLRERRGLSARAAAAPSVARLGGEHRRASGDHAREVSARGQAFAEAPGEQGLI